MDYYLPQFAEKNGHVEKSSTIKLSRILQKPPINGLDIRAYQIEGIRYLRVQNIRPFEFNLDDVKFIHDTPKKSKVVLETGDILITRKGTYGVATLVTPDVVDSIISSEIILLRLSNDSKFLPEFVVAWINSQYAQSLLTQNTTGQMMGHLTQKVISDFPVPDIDVDTQRALVADLDQARATRKAKLAEADDLLKGMDEVVMGELGLQLPAKSEPTLAFAVRLEDMIKDNRFNADYFHPERTIIVEAIQNQYKSSSKLLGKIVNFIRDIISISPNDAYMGLASIQSHTGERILIAETADGQAFQFQIGDVLYGRLRPYLNKVYYAEDTGYCSTEFHVMRVIDENELLGGYLATLLRTKLILNQTKHMMSGNTHPRLTNDAVINLIIPIPSRDIQQRIAGELHKRRDRARQLRHEAEALWREAQSRFEQALIV